MEIAPLLFGYWPSVTKDAVFGIHLTSKMVNRSDFLMCSMICWRLKRRFSCRSFSCCSSSVRYDMVYKHALTLKTRFSVETIKQPKKNAKGQPED